MAGDSDLVKQAVQLADDGRDLLGEVARVHGDCCRPASGVVNCTYTGRTPSTNVVGLEHVQLAESGGCRRGMRVSLCWWLFVPAKTRVMRNVARIL